MDLVLSDKPLLFDALEANDTDRVAVLLEDGADPNTEFEGILPLRIAIRNTNAYLVTLLLSYGANVHAEDRDSYNFLNEAINTQSEESPQATVEIIELLFTSGFDPNKLPSNGHLAFECLLCCGLNYPTTQLKELTQLFLSYKAHPTNVVGKGNPFVAAASWADKALIQRFLCAGADINTCDGWGITPLMTAAQKNRVSTIKLLLSLGALVNTQSYTTKITALHSAAGNGHSRALKLLLQAQAQVNIQDAYGTTPLMELLENDELNHLQVIECAQLLLRAGADYTQLKSNKQRTAQESARKRGIFLERLI